MSPQAQRVAICAFMKWKPPYAMTINCEWLDSASGIVMRSDPLKDLNACHEMEKVLTINQRLDYRRNLNELVGGCRTNLKSFEQITATAAQRCEAFLRTVGKWQEDAT